MAKFSTTTLSTGESLSKKEFEIVTQAQYTEPAGTIAITSNVGTLSEEDDFDLFSLGDIITLADDLSTELKVLSKTAPDTIQVTNTANYASGAFQIQTWQPKIELAKTEITRELKVMLNRKFNQNNYEDDLIDMINNAEDFNLVSDFLVLKMIYEDMMISSETSDIYQKKAEMYERYYKNALTQALELVDLDLDFDGDTDIEEAQMRQISRILR